jgi:hypothetical protein
MMSWASQELIRRKAMTGEQELEPIEANEATEALKLLIAEGDALLRRNIEDFGEFRHWASLALTALEPLPVHQEHFKLKCWQKRGPVYFRIREGVHLLKQSLRKMADPEFRVDDPSLGYRRLIMSLPD